LCFDYTPSIFNPLDVLEKRKLLSPEGIGIQDAHPVKVKVKQSRYRPGVAQRDPGS
jgi:hypothetical protein